MTEKFVTPEPLPTPYERELLTILIEEAAEVQQRATKMLRFGIHEVQPGQPHTNRERLSIELGDLMAVITLSLEPDVDLINAAIVENQIEKKIIKLEKFMQSSKPEKVEDD